jgi:hypothetical protein
MRPSLLVSHRFTALAALVMASACSAGEAGLGDQGQPEGLAEAVPDGKADDYLSPTSAEYKLSGEGTLTLDDAWLGKTEAEREAHARELLGYKFKAYAHFVNVYVSDKEHADQTAAYGGFSGLVRSSSVGSVLNPTDGQNMSWVFQWNLEMGGPRDLMSRLPVQTTPEGAKYFLAKMPVLDEAALLAGKYAKDFNPATYQGPIEDFKVQIEQLKASHDAWPDYNAIFDDGKLDILILIGGDYNEGRYDLKAAEEIFRWLKGAGYAHPASAYSELTLDSPPLTRSFRANGKEIAIEVTFLHPDIVEDAELPALRQKIIEAYQTKDVLIYDGHSGEDPSYSGVVYHYNPRHGISANELAQLSLPSKYQIYLFNGCKTYGAYPDALYKAPLKNTKNLDIISTVSFSWLSMQPFTTSGFLNQLTAVSGGTHDPRTYLEILSQINKSSNWNVYYGVHGIDDNGHINPYADLSSLCSSCTSDASCPGVGNKCVRMSQGQACAAECTADDGCPQGYSCTKIASNMQITGMQCLPKTQRCE